MPQKPKTKASQQKHPPLQLEFGWMCPTIAEQLKKQGIRVDGGRTSGWQKLAEATLLLPLHKVISKATALKAQQKLTLIIADYLRNRHTKA